MKNIKHIDYLFILEFCSKMKHNLTQQCLADCLTLIISQRVWISILIGQKVCSLHGSDRSSGYNMKWIEECIHLSTLLLLL